MSLLFFALCHLAPLFGAPTKFGVARRFLRGEAEEGEVVVEGEEARLQVTFSLSPTPLLSFSSDTGEDSLLMY